MPNKRIGCFGISLLILLALSLLINFLLLVGATTTQVSSASLIQESAPKFDESVVLPGKDKDQKIARIDVRGLISGMESGGISDSMVEDLKLQCLQAGDDPKVCAIVLNIDSPGGEVTASDTIYNAIRKVRDEKKKPVVVHMGSLAASGGYYIACAGSHLIAHETTFTGSIGVIMQGVNYEQLFGKIGLQMMTFKSGKFKDMLSGSRPMTDEEREYVQGLVMQTYDRFVGIVARERKIPEDSLRAGVADGRVVSGKDALAARLIDSLGELEDAYAKARDLAKQPGAGVIRYEAPFKLGKLFRMMGHAESKKIEVEVLKELTPRLEVGRLYYLPSFFVP